MNMIYFLVAIIVAILIACVGIFLFLTRSGKNLVKTIIFNKKYVVCHLKNKNTGFMEDWRVVPPSDYITEVGKHHYNLNPKYAILKWKGRNHFSLNLGDATPEYLTRTYTDTNEILTQVDELDTAVNTRAYKIIYGKKMDLALIICGVAFCMAFIVAIYAVYTIEQVSPFIEWLYAHPPGTMSNVTIIKP